jgi:hypothetical protein
MIGSKHKRICSEGQNASTGGGGGLLVAGLVAGFVSLLATGPASGDVALVEGGPLNVYGDFRARQEFDWDSQRANGAMRTDRTRARIRARFGFKYKPIDELEFGMRARSGNQRSQQSPHVTIADFSSDDHGERSGVLDKYFAKVSLDPVWVWGGSNGFPFWKQNEHFWDDDVTLLGGAAGGGFDTGVGKLSVTTGVFALPDGMMSHQLGKMIAGQLKYSGDVAEGIKLNAAAGYFDMKGKDGAVNIRNGNGARDYQIGVVSVQAKLLAMDMPITLGVDFMHNFESYSASDSNAFTVANRNERDGFILSAKVGKLKEWGDWLVGYYFARIETLAVNASYAQDDWVRWGSANQTDSSDLRGHEFRTAFAISGRTNLVARLYIVDAITSTQDGKRFRIDFNTKF